MSRARVTLRKVYRLFFGLHVVFILMVLVISVLHRAPLVLIGGGFWLMDLLLRLFLMFFYKRRIKKATLTNLPGNVIRTVFEMQPGQSFRYKSGQYVCICIPEISCYEWHPLSISSSPHENEFSLHFSAIGNWTKRVQQAINQKGINIKFKTPKESFIRSAFKQFMRQNSVQSNPNSSCLKLQKKPSTSEKSWSVTKRQSHLQNPLQPEIRNFLYSRKLPQNPKVPQNRR